jgi:hypothetical protein
MVAVNAKFISRYKKKMSDVCPVHAVLSVTNFINVV